MEKLKHGDYVTDLTEKQFNELVSMSYLNSALTYGTSLSIEFGDWISKSLVYDKRCLQHASKKTVINKLSYREFKKRLINTVQ